MGGTRVIYCEHGREDPNWCPHCLGINNREVPFVLPSEFWKIASDFPANKELVYPDHARAQEFDKHRGKTVLEYGCGGGSDTMSYLRRGNTVYYCDIVPRNIEVTRQRIMEMPRCEFDWTAHPTLLPESHLVLPVQDKICDVVSSHGVIHHIPEPAPILKEFFRVLRPGGLLYIMLYTEHLWKRFEDEVRSLKGRKGISESEAFGWCTDGEGCPYARAYTRNEGEQLLAGIGFAPLDVVEFNEEPPLFRTFRAMRPWGASSHGW